MQTPTSSFTLLLQIIDCYNYSLKVPAFIQISLPNISSKYLFQISLDLSIYMLVFQPSNFRYHYLSFFFVIIMSSYSIVLTASDRNMIWNACMRECEGYLNRADFDRIIREVYREILHLLVTLIWSLPPQVFWTFRWKQHDL